MPKSSKNILSKITQSTNSVLQFSKNNSKIVREMSFMKENSKETIAKYSKLGSVKRMS